MSFLVIYSTLISLSKMKSQGLLVMNKVRLWKAVPTAIETLCMLMCWLLNVGQAALLTQQTHTHTNTVCINFYLHDNTHT